MGKQGKHDFIIDGAGNKVDLTQGAGELCDRDKKKEIKALEKILRESKDIKKPEARKLSEEERWEMEDKLAALKESCEDAKAAAAVVQDDVVAPPAAEDVVAPPVALGTDDAIAPDVPASEP